MSSEHPSQANTPNTYILDVDNGAEMARLIRLDQMTTKSLGGLLAGLPPLPDEAHVLDVACGSGGWALDMAFAHSTMELVGIDISDTLITHANAVARTQHLENISFKVMDATKPFAFPDHSFDLVNARLITAFLLKKAWPGFLSECLRILRPGGIFRITETDGGGNTSSPAFNRLNELLYKAMHARGYGFSTDGSNLGITAVLGQLIEQAGFLPVQQQAHTMDVSAQTDAWDDFYHNSEIVFDQVLPMLHNYHQIPLDSLNSLFQEMLIEIQKRILVVHCTC